MEPNLNVSEHIKISRIDGSLQRGGWQIYFNVLGDTDLFETYQRITIYWTGAFGSGDFEGVGRLAFKGHVIPLRFRFDRTGSQAEYLAQTTDGMLRLGWLQGIHFVDTNAIARLNYHRFDSVTGVIERMTMGRIVRHLLGYYDSLGVPPTTNPDWVAHTNLVFSAAHNPHGWITLDNVTTIPFADPAALNGSMRVNRYIVRETDNLWSSIRQIAQNEFFVAYFDKQDNFYYMRHPMYATVLPTPVMTFDQSFVIGRPVVEVRSHAGVTGSGVVRQVILHAVQDAGTTIHAEYPTSPTHVYGKVEERTYIRCNSQDALDRWAYVLYMFLNRDSTVRWTAPGLSGLLFDILDRVQITYTGTTENGVHIDWTEKKFWIHEIAVTPSEEHSGTSQFVLEAENV